MRRSRFEKVSLYYAGFNSTDFRTHPKRLSHHNTLQVKGLRVTESAAWPLPNEAQETSSSVGHQVESGGLPVNRRDHFGFPIPGVQRHATSGSAMEENRERRCEPEDEAKRPPA